jgi:[protein-PII] uridylyltransferase
VLAVEDFMRDYYRHAIKVEYLVSNLVSRCVWRDEGSIKVLGYFIRRQVAEGCYVLKGELVVPDESIVQKDPTILIRVFELAQKHNVELDVRVMGMIRRNLSLINDKFRRNREVNKSFMNILRAPKGVAATLRMMHHLEFLNHFIPEMEHIYCKVQHDIYHIYTVDIHSLFAVEQAEKLLNGELKEALWFPCEIATRISQPELFVLAVLLHDIGKGCGGNHSEKGAEMVPTIARRMGLSKECSERLEFLVRHHLLFAHIAQRRDLNDEKMVIQFARQMGTSENLMMLYLLTVADVRAVGSDVWTNWKSLLFQELYEKSFSILERGDFHLEASSERVKKVIRKVVEFIGSEFSSTSVQAELKAMPVRLLLSGNIPMIADHVRMLIRQDRDDIVMEVIHREEPGYSDFTICTVDMPGLFSRITGVMAANGVNILGAQINTSRNSKVLDILQVNSASGVLIRDDKRWQKVQEDMRLVLHGKADVAAMVEKRQRPSILTMRATPRFPTTVEFDNEVSEGYTVIDVYTHDKVGLLYLITSTLTKLGLYIGVSKISTKVDQVADVFYVRDIFGHKIYDPDKLERIKHTLVEAIDEWV